MTNSFCFVFTFTAFLLWPTGGKSFKRNLRKHEAICHCEEDVLKYC